MDLCPCHAITKALKMYLWLPCMEVSIIRQALAHACHVGYDGSSFYISKPLEPPRWKTNNVVSEQVRHKPSCTSSEDG